MEKKEKRLLLTSEDLDLLYNACVAYREMLVEAEKKAVGCPNALKDFEQKIAEASEMAVRLACNLPDNLKETEGSKTEPAGILSIGVNKDFLKDFYYGNLEIGVRSEEGYSGERMRTLIDMQEKLQTELTPGQWKTFQEYGTKLSDYATEEACRMFQNGYRTAVRLIVAGLDRA